MMHRRALEVVLGISRFVLSCCMFLLCFARVFSSFADFSPDPFETTRRVLETLPGAYQTLLSGNPITCAVKGTNFDALPRPSIAIVDVSFIKKALKQ